MPGPFDRRDPGLRSDRLLDPVDVASQLAAATRDRQGDRGCKKGEQSAARRR
jgi:hypothetical protein